MLKRIHTQFMVVVRINCALVVRATGAMLQTKKINGAVGAQWKVLAS